MTDDPQESDEPMSSREIARQLRSINRALGGDPLNPDKPGFIQVFWNLHRDYYGDKKAGVIGSKQKADRLWEDKTKIMAACAVLAALGSILVKLFWK